ncbi:MAG: DUF4382 domain-containing protein [Anaerolineae bacterium]|nr:DUF4382 domain-containing protein [Anaerolineae bacterium]
MFKTRAFGLLLIGLLLMGTSASFAQDATGTLSIYANGEDFVRQGFVSKDGWAITFDHVYITLGAIAAYQTDPPYEAVMGDEISVINEANLPDVYTIDLAAGDEDAEPILVAEVAAPEGRYNALTWAMVPVPEGSEISSEISDEVGDIAGYSLFVVGTATKEDTTLTFTIKIEQAYTYICGEYVGDERKGILDADDVADLEMTFHFDHIFGDGDLPLDDGLNEGAPGFAPFAALAADGQIDVDLAALEAALSAADYQMVVDILPTLGHVGEGHCYEAVSGYGQHE